MQKELIPVYFEKWRQIALNCEQLDRNLTINAINQLYDFIGRSQPEIIFYSSPYEIILESDRRKLKKNIGLEIYKSYLNFTQDFLFSKPEFMAELELESYIPTGIIKAIYQGMQRKIKTITKAPRLRISNWGYNFFFPQFKAYELSIVDFCISELDYDRTSWHIFDELARSCCGIYPCEKIVFVSDRPRQISVDKNNRLHSQLTPAIEFSDGFNIYAYRGIILPPKYSKLPPDLWPDDWYLKEEDLELKWQLIEVLPSNLLQVSWLLAETNSELRTRLIQRIGYDSIYQQLPTQKLDSWREYELLKIQAKIDCEPIHFLKMICPSTNKIHILRVPPNISSARKAVTWINWGVDPEEFTVET